MINPPSDSVTYTGSCHVCILYPIDALRTSAPTFKITPGLFFKDLENYFSREFLCISSWGHKVQQPPLDKLSR